MVAAVDDPYAKGATRSELTLGRMGQAWAARLKGPRFVRALTGFISSGGSRYTTRTYAYAVLGFWEWLDAKNRGLPTPDELSRQDAVSYERWLRESGENLVRYRLAADPARRMDLAIYDYVISKPGCDIRDLRGYLQSLGRFSTGDRLYVDDRCAGGLHRYLGAMVINKVLRREPTIEQVRSMPEYRPSLRSGDLSSLFRYYPEDSMSPGDNRVCGNATRIGVLAAFWSYMASQGENLPGSEEPLIRFNIWDPVLKRVREQASSHQVERRITRTPGGDLFARVLATTYRSSHGDRALEAAEAATRGEVIPSTRGKFSDLRDRALLLVMLQAGGPRASEVQHMRRADVSDDLSTLTIHGKRNKVRTVPVPPAAADAISQMTARIIAVIERRRAQGRTTDRLEELLYAEAPLLPAIRYWGANIGSDESCGLTRAGIAMRLRHLAKAAGLAPGSREFAQMHPHGIRRLFAKQHMAMGTPLNILQTLMGHASPSTTLGYAEEKDVGALRTAAFGAAKRPVARVEGPAMPPVVSVAQEPVRPALPPPAPARELGGLVREPIEAPAVVRVVREQPKPSRRAERKPVSEECAIVPVGHERTLCDMYESSWGEKGDRTRVSTGPGVEAAKAMFAVETAMIPEEVIGGRMTSFGQTKRLEHVYCGRETGLPWWAGSDGKLVPEMPVASVNQLGAECGPETRSTLCQMLVSLWSEWSDDPQRGPTAATALGMWVAEFLETAAQVDKAIEERDGRWVEHLAPIEETVLGGTKREPEARYTFREHSEERIMQWFRETAWQFRLSIGREREGGELEKPRERKLVGAPLTPPPWYALEDPISELSSSDADDVLDLVAALTRGTLVSRTPRWGALSRKSCSDLIHAMVDYDKALNELRETKNKIRIEAPDFRAKLKDLADEQAARAGEARDIANALFASLGAAGFDLGEVVKRRAAVRRAAMEKRRKVWHFHLDLLRRVFGDGPADDPYVQLAARHEQDPPLKDTQHKDLLDPDWPARTITHTPSMILSWAKTHGTHSECVARRLARHMWELFAASRGGARQFARNDELLNYVMALTAYRVPCPTSQEAKLRGLLRWEKIDIPIYERWTRVFDTAKAEAEAELPGAEEYALPGAVYEGEKEEGLVGEETYRALAEEFGEEFFQRNPHSLKRDRARSSLPNPLLLLLLLLPFIPP